MSNYLYTLPNNQFNVDRLDEALDSIIDTQSDMKLKNIVIFIHGRGAGNVKHPRKAITQQLPFIESEYNTKVVLFNWEGSAKGGITGFPEKKARGASPDLFKILSQLKRYKNENSERLDDVKFTMLTHSMGSIVVEETIIRNSDEIQPELLDVLLFSSPASKSKNHSKWLNKATLAKNVLVTLNAEDGVLGPAGARKFSRRLGKGLKKKETSNLANYVDFSNTGVNHRYFIAHTKKGTKKGQNGNTCIKAFYHGALNGTPVNLKTFPGTKNDNNNRVFTFKSKGVIEC